MVFYSSQTNIFILFISYRGRGGWKERGIKNSSRVCGASPGAIWLIPNKMRHALDWVSYLSVPTVSISVDDKTEALREADSFPSLTHEVTETKFEARF